MTLQLVRLPVDLTGLARIAGERGWTRGRRQHFDEGAALHHLLAETFGAAALQPFRLAVAPRQRHGRVYAYATQTADQLIDTARMAATPEVVEVLSPADMQAKTMPDDWRAGRQVGFDLRLRPTVRLSSPIPAPSDSSKGGDQGFRKGAEIDAYLAEALRHPHRGEMARTGRSREEVYRDWLAPRLGSAAKLEEVRLAAFRRAFAARGGKAQEAPDIVMHGTMTIQDAERFVGLMTNGIGRHRAYGYGMLLLRPPVSRAG